MPIPAMLVERDFDQFSGLAPERVAKGETLDILEDESRETGKR